MAHHQHLLQFAGKRVFDFQRGEPLEDPAQIALRIRLDFAASLDAVGLLGELVSDGGCDRLTALVKGR